MLQSKVYLRRNCESGRRAARARRARSQANGAPATNGVSATGNQTEVGTGRLYGTEIGIGTGTATGRETAAPGGGRANPGAEDAARRSVQMRRTIAIGAGERCSSSFCGAIISEI